MMTSPTVARWELSRRLGARRRELGLKVDEIAKHLSFSRNYWSAVENDRTLIAKEKLVLLMDLMEFSDEDRTELLALREDSRQRGWWDTHPGLPDDEARRLCGLEDGAVRIRTYDSSLLPGLLQTEEYTRAVVGSDPGIRRTTVDDIVDARVRRQRRLHGSNAVRLTSVISQAALLQEMGGKEVQARQLDHLVDMVERHKTIDVRISPFDTNPGIIVNATTLVLFEFSSPHLPTIAWQEAIRSLGVIDEHDSEQLRRLDMAWEVGSERSLSPTKSLALIRQTAHALLT